MDYLFCGIGNIDIKPNESNSSSYDSMEFIFNSIIAYFSEL